MKRKVLITGAAGFIGSHLAGYLRSLNFEVAACDLYNFRNQFFDVGDSHHLNLQRLRHDRLQHFLLPKLIEYHTMDLSDPDAVIGLFKTVKPDIVVHLAAQAGVRHSVKAPMDFVRSNLNGFANVLDACKQFEIEQFLYASSSSVYGARNTSPFIESERCDKPESFYAATKIANELMAQAYFVQYGTPSLGLRFFTVYGPWGRLDMAPIMFAQKIRRKQVIQLFGNGELKRDFTYIDDVVQAVGHLIQLGYGKNRAEVINVGHSNPVQVLDFLQTLSECLEMTPLVEMAPMQISDVPLTCASSQKLESWIGQWPHTPLKEGLHEMTEWLNKWHAL